MKKVTHILVTLTFAFACLSLWAILSLLGHVSTQYLPGFTRLCLGWSSLLLLLPIPVMAYCVFALVGRRPLADNGTAFLACTMSALCMVGFPVLIAIFLPCVRLLEK